MRIAIVNDLRLAVEALRRVLAGAKQHSIAWVAMDGAEAVRKCHEDRPDLILMDLIMPEMDGVEATRRIMLECPCAILLVTATVEGNVNQVFSALGVGALDAVTTPTLFNVGRSVESNTLLYKIDSIEKQLKAQGKLAAERVEAQPVFAASQRPSLLVIGASAGGPAALAAVLSKLPTNFPAPIIMVQHVDEQFMASMAAWLATQSKIPVRLAVEGERPVPGVALLAGKGDHLIFKDSQILGYTRQAMASYYSPSIDVFFESVLEKCRYEVIAVLLTGMGADGAKGLKRLRDAGAYTIAQDQGTSAVYGMPKAAAALGAAVDILPLDDIASAVCRHLGRAADDGLNQSRA